MLFYSHGVVSLYDYIPFCYFILLYYCKLFVVFSLYSYSILVLYFCSIYSYYRFVVFIISYIDTQLYYYILILQYVYTVSFILILVYPSVSIFVHFIF